MTRTLPWLRDDPKGAKKESRTLPRPVKRQGLVGPVSDEDDDDLNTTRELKPAREPQRRRRGRTPATSPPPAPPPVEPMHEGLDADDGYIMVEDEFLSVAHKFTQHLHHAEYQRLKREVKTKNASKLSSMARPLDKQTLLGEELDRQPGADHLVGKRRDGFVSKHNDAGSDEDQHDDPWVGTSLFGLMTSPKRGQRSLTGVKEVRSGSRAAAGYKRGIEEADKENTIDAPLTKGARKVAGEKQEHDDSQEEDDGEDDDDLDAPAIKLVRKVRWPPASISIMPPRKHGPPAASIKAESTDSEMRLSASSFETPPSSPPTSGDMTSHDRDQRLVDIKARRTIKAAQLQKHQLIRKKSALLGEIPTFLF